MLTTLNAIKSYLTAAKTTYFSDIKTIEEYSGDLFQATRDQKVIKLRHPLPAAYIMYIDGFPIAEDPQLQFDLLVITQNKTFDKNANQVSNLTISDGICRSIRLNPGWQYNNKPYLIDKEQLKVRTLLQDDRFDVKIINLFIRNLA